MRVVLADCQGKVRSALRLLLEQECEACVAVEADDAGSLLLAVQDFAPDLLLMDWHLPGQPPEELLAALRAECPGAFIAVLSGRPEVCDVALAAGANAFVCKGDPPEMLLDVLAQARAASPHGK